MTTIKSTVLFLLLAAGLAVGSCSKKNDFKGRDNFITAFSLKKGGATFSAAITDSSVIITAPDGLSLDSAQATMTLSENASVYPSPSSIVAWNDEYVFTVTSYNGMKKSYTYTVKRQGKPVEGTVVLATQADVDAFAKSGVTEITGNLIIGSTGGTDSITNLNGLFNLKKVGYSLIFYPTYSGQQIIGLDNLQSVGGTLQIELLNDLVSINLPALQTVGNISVNTVITESISFPKLTSVDKTVSLNVPLNALSLPNLSRVGEQLTLTTDPYNGAALIQVLSFPKLKSAKGIVISNFRQTTKVDLPELTSTADLDLFNMTGVYDLSCPSLQSTTGTITISDSTKLDQISFPALVQAGGLAIRRKALNSAEFPLLKTVTGSLAIQATALKSLSIPALQEVDGDMIIEQLQQLSQATLEIPGLRKVGGNFSVLIESAATTTLKLTSLATVGGDLNVGTGFGDRSLSALSFPALQTVGGQLNVYADQAPSSLNTKLTGLDGFSTLTTATSISITGQSVLTSFQGLQNALPSFSSDKWMALDNGYNPSYEDLKAGNWTKP